MAAILWLLNAFNKDYSTELELPVAFTNVPDNRVAVSPLPDKFNVNVKAEGWQLLRAYFGKAPSLQVDISRFVTSNTFFPNAHLDYFNQQLAPVYEASGITPRSISFEFDELKTRKVPVQFVDQITFEPPYERIGEVGLTPDSVDVTGPARLVDSLRWIDTRPAVMKNVDEAVTSEVEIAPDSLGMLSFAPARIGYTFEVAQFTEERIEVPIRASHVEAVTLTPARASVSFRIALEDLPLLQDSLFLSAFDVLADLTNASEDEVELRLVSSPESVRNPTIAPRYVSYLFLK